MACSSMEAGATCGSILWLSEDGIICQSWLAGIWWQVPGCPPRKSLQNLIKLDAHIQKTYGGSEEIMEDLTARIIVN